MNNCDKTNEDAMRINERALASYSVSSATPVDRAGWLWKRGEVNREGVLANCLILELFRSQLKNSLCLIKLTCSVVCKGQCVPFCIHVPTYRQLDNVQE